ncbi:HDOD domain-containing protein [bacterium]|nr:HDOD domain-containing protein [bacterium]
MARDIIAAGDYAIRTEGNGQLVAHLGTCVGVALHDSENGIGGVAHFLLAEPYGPIPTSQTFSYASSGLPLFIDLLKQSGADPQKMEAVVAGGSLVGPVSDLDVNLDIGGRTAEKVMQILHDHSIKVLRSETGGWHGCRLSYEVETGSCDITYFERDDNGHHDTSSLPPRMEDADIEEAIAAVNPIPQTVLKLIRMISEGDYEMRDIAKNVRQDQVLSARVLNLCNSAFFARRSRISSIDTALVLLGERSFIQMILSASVESFYNDIHDGYSLVKGGLFFHALGTAIVSEKIAAVVKKIDPSIAYTSGLLHDIGKVVLDQFIARRWSIFYRAVKDPSVNLLEFERKLMGANHVEIGMRLGKEWALPDELISVIKNHHRPLEADLEPRLVAIVSLADLLMSRFQVGLELERFSTVDLEGVLEVLGIQPDEFQQIVMEIPWSDFGALLSYESS